MIALFLAFAALQLPPPAAPVIYVLDHDGWMPMNSGPADREIVPLLTRSERVPRATITSEGIGLRVWSGSGSLATLSELRVEAVEHAGDERLVWVRGDGKQPYVLSNARLPATLRVPLGRPSVEDSNALSGAADLERELPRIARHDGETIPSSSFYPQPWLKRLELSAAIVYLTPYGIDASDSFVDPDSKAVWYGHHAATLHRLHSLNDWVDQVVIADIAPVTSSRSVALSPRSARLGRAALARWSPLRGVGPIWPELEWDEPGASKPTIAALDVAERSTAGSFIEVWFDAPPVPQEGRTWTLLVSLFGGSNWPPVADAPRFEGLRDPRNHVQAAALNQSAFDERAKSSRLFRDVALEEGIEMVHFEGPDLQLDIRPTMGPGCAWGDVDGDGWVDLFLPQGGGREGSTPPRAKLYRNVDGKRFGDASDKSGLDLVGAGMGALFFDFEGDGDLDLFVANYGVNTLRLNDGKGVFSDATTLLSPNPSRWNAAVSAADYDKDGDLDLYVTSYLLYDVAQIPPAEELGRYQREDPLEMLPFAFPGEIKSLLRNDLVDGSRAFRDVAKELGLEDPMGRGMQALWWDFDRDGDEDLYLANDVSPNRIWRNEGDGTFKDIGMSTGLDDPRGCMGLAAGDVDGDLDEDLVVTNWQLESNALYVNNLRHTSARSRVATFRDRAVEAGLGQLSVGVTGWGCELADFDLDGDLDLFIANGYTSPDYESTGICVGQPCHYFENDGTGKFTAAFEKAGPDVAVPLASRAASACDYDQDGDLDLVVTANNGRVRLLRNELAHGKRHWLGLRLRGKGANTRAIGAQVEITVGERKLLRTLRAGTSYLAGNPPELHFGLGEATKIDACSIRWPSGKTTTHAIEGVDRFVTLEEP